ncbi:MAG: DUF5320 domain-containing protein [Candidatus Omnitrophota bacterium]
MTGRGRGICAGYADPGYTNPLPGRGAGYGRGFSRGLGMGRGSRGGCARGFGWRAGAVNNTAPGSGVTDRQEAQMLKDQVKLMQEEMNAINGRIKEMESRPTADQDGS